MNSVKNNKTWKTCNWVTWNVVFLINDSLLSLGNPANLPRFETPERWGRFPSCIVANPMTFCCFTPLVCRRKYDRNTFICPRSSVSWSNRPQTTLHRIPLETWETCRYIIYSKSCGRVKTLFWCSVFALLTANFCFRCWFVCVVHLFQRESICATWDSTWKGKLN